MAGLIGHEANNPEQGIPNYAHKKRSKFGPQVSQPRTTPVLNIDPIGPRVGQDDDKNESAKMSVLLANYLIFLINMLRTGILL